MNYFNSLADLPAGSRVFVFGAGVAGEVLLAFLAASPGVAVGGVIDNRRTGSFQGFPIRDWSGFLAQAGPDCVVLIASSKAAEIRAGLEGFPGERIYDAYLLACHLDLQRTVAIHELARQRDAAWNELHLRQVRAYLEVERWRVKALQRECFGEPEACPVPAGEIPPELLERFSMGGLARVYADYDNATYPANYPLIYRPEEVDACLARIRRGESYYYDQTDLWLQEAMDRFPAGGREVAVVGSRSPWFEAVCLAHGGRPVTIEFNPIRVADPRLRAMTFGLGAAISGIAGGLMSQIAELRPTSAVDFTILVVIIVLMGGLDSVGGALLAGLVVGVAEALAGVLLGPSLKGLFGCALVVLLLLFRPRGLLEPTE